MIDEIYHHKETVVGGRKIMSLKKFDGVEYRKYATVDNTRSANKTANTLEEEGFKVKVEKAPNENPHSKTQDVWVSLNKTKPKGLLCWIFQAKGFTDCSNKGLSSRVEKVVLVGEGIPEITEANENSPAVKVIRRELWEKECDYIEPVEAAKKGNVHWMFGGCLIYCSDSRFPSNHPIKLHDRQETQEEYDALSQ